jgi:MoaA/NifB/PqqE/SkfB family radical SAM enzyme
MNHMDFQIEADWQLLNTCNFRCPYCLSDQALLGEKVRIHATPEAWAAAFDATRLTWLLHLTGGEPTVYPQFMELCQALTRRHFISLNTNLTGPALPAFARTIDPGRVSFINAGLHLEERERLGDHARFLNNAEQLRAAGFPILASLVATPSVLARFEEAVALLAPIGLYPIPKLLREWRDGPRFPEAYSDEDRARFRAHAAAARAFYAPALEAMTAPPTINMFGDDAFLDGVPDYVGASCRAGAAFVGLDPNGDVFRCSRKTRLGNLLDGSFAPMAGPTACDTGYCFYWCEKYATRSAPAAGHWLSRAWRRRAASWI